MTQYRSKSALVAEIERIEHETNYEPFTGEVLGKRCACMSLLSFLDTLEVKEVDLDELLSNLDKDIKEFVTTQEFEKDSAVYGHYWAIAKHAFLFGLKVKGE